MLSICLFVYFFGIMRIYDYFLQEKQKLTEDKILLFQSWVFYKAFESDARLLSDKLWLRIMKSWANEVVWFPVSSLSKYLESLEENAIGYIVFEKNGEWFELTKEFSGWADLSYDENNLKHISKKTPEKEVKPDLTEFLKELKDLLNKYF